MSGTTSGPEDPAIVGRVVRPHGLAGDLVVAPAEGAIDVPLEGERVWLGGAWREVRSGRFDNKGRWVVRFVGIADRDAAEALRGESLSVDAGDLPELEDDRFYIHDLIGCRLEDPQGNLLGTVVGVAPGAQDQLEIENAGSMSLVPMAKDWLREIDTEGRRIVIDAPPGLFDATGN